MLVAIVVYLIGFASNIGYVSVDPNGNIAKSRAIFVIIARYWILGVAKNTLHGPCRALSVDTVVQRLGIPIFRSHTFGYVAKSRE